MLCEVFVFFFKAKEGIRDLVRCRGLGDVYKRQGPLGPTDVLAFPIDAAEAEIVLMGQPPSRGPDRAPPDPGDMPLLLGDVVICPAVAARQAPTHAGTLEDEFALLVVHGRTEALSAFRAQLAG